MPKTTDFAPGWIPPAGMNDEVEGGAPAPQPARALAAVREPLSDEQVWANDDIMAVNAVIGGRMHALMSLVRAVEAAHGIGITAQAQQEGGR